MPKHEHILKELGSISKYIAGLNIDHPFSVPDGYFDALPAQVMKVIKTSDIDEENQLPRSRQLANPFHVPQNYFDNLANEVLSRIREQDPVAEIKTISPLLAGIEKRNPFSTPEGYFDDMPANVSAGIQAIHFVESELEILPPALIAARRINVFEAPTGYFDQLAGSILSQVKPSARVVKMSVPKRVMKYAAAAAVVGIIAISAWLYNRNGIRNADTTIAAVNLDSSLQQLSDAEIRNYVESNLNVVLPDPGVNAGNDLDPQDMHALLADISDRELERYVENYGLVNDNHTN